MAKKAYWVAFDLEHNGAGWDAVSYTKGSTGKTLPIQEYGKGFRAQAMLGVIAKVEAESFAEAAEVARNGYGSDGGLTLVALETTAGAETAVKVEEI